MLNRRILRIKAFKVLYSLAENPTMTLKEAEALLEESCESTRDLYMFLLCLCGPLTQEAMTRIEAARLKFNPTEEERNPNLKFANNLIAPYFADDPDFSKIVKKKKLSWAQYDVLLRHLYDSIKTEEFFAAYMQDPESSLEQDALLFRDIFASQLEDNTELEDILEDLSILWNDDLAYAINCCIRTFEDLSKGKQWAYPELYPVTTGKNTDKSFVVNLVRAGYHNFQDFYQQIASITPKWDKSRICATDLALIVCGLAENAAFPDMPKKVIINEYVEISKFYSTPESRSFVNGILDKLINKQ